MPPKKAAVRVAEKADGSVVVVPKKKKRKSKKKAEGGKVVPYNVQGAASKGLEY